MDPQTSDRKRKQLAYLTSEHPGGVDRPAEVQASIDTLRTELGEMPVVADAHQQEVTMLRVSLNAAVARVHELEAKNATLRALAGDRNHDGVPDTNGVNAAALEAPAG